GVVMGATFIPGKVGQAFSFDGVDDMISFGPNTGNFGTNDFTVDFWIRTTSTRVEEIITKRPGCGAGTFWGIWLGQTNFGNGKLTLELSQQGSVSLYNNIA